MARDPLTEQGYTVALKHEGESLERLARYERKAMFWIGKLVEERKRSKRIRRRIEESDQAVREGVKIPKEKAPKAKAKAKASR